jgi:hypothetical protein
VPHFFNTIGGEQTQAVRCRGGLIGAVSGRRMVLADSASGYDFKLSDDERRARKIVALASWSTNAIDHVCGKNMARTATCACGQLTVSCDGEPGLVSLCHGLACQRRTGSHVGSPRFSSATALVSAGRDGATPGHPTVGSMSLSTFARAAALQSSGNHSANPR